MRELDCLELYRDAEFYDREFAERLFELPFYRRFAERCGDPILELACGTGRLTIPLAKDGFHIVGLDVSKPMLTLAEEKAQRQGLEIEWLHQDCRQIVSDRRFKLIFTATNAMQHLLDHESVEAFLRSVREKTSSNGTLIIDVMNPDVRRLSRGPEERYLQKTFFDRDGDRIEVEAASQYRADQQILHFELTYRRGEDVIKTKSVNMRCFFPEELLALCRQNDWCVVQRFGDYDESLFTSTSPKQLLICRLA